MGQGWPPRGHLKDRGDREHGHSRAWAGAYGPADLPQCLMGTLWETAATQPGLKREAIHVFIDLLALAKFKFNSGLFNS